MTADELRRRFGPFRRPLLGLVCTVAALAVMFAALPERFTLALFAAAVAEISAAATGIALVYAYERVDRDDDR